MEYLSSLELEDLNAKELLIYYKRLKERKQELLDEIYLWGSTIRSAKMELQYKMLYIEEELAIAEHDRKEDGLDLNDTLNSVN